MAPPPEYDKEPKAPDKSTTSISDEDSKVLLNAINDYQTNSDNKPATAANHSDVENNKHVEHLDDGQLRALLDEAITYKCPKDREGKSSLFKELLEEVEQDEQACEAAARSSGTSGGSRATRRSGRSRRALPHSNSLQDLVAALAAEPAPRRHRHHAPTPAPSNVSARAIHGGSLPSGVDTSFLLGEEPARGGYLATVRCVNPPPLAERRVSQSDANSPPEPELVNRRSKPMFPMTYTARATLEIGSGSVCTGRAVTTTTASNQVDSAIPFSCITTPEVVTSCNTTSSTSQSTVVVDPKPLQLGSSYRAVASLTGAEPEPALPALSALSADALASQDHPPTTADATSAISAISAIQQKSLDENGNSVQGFNSPLSGSSQHKKPRRKKSSKNETVIKSHQIDGYQGNKDLNEVLRFIESNADQGRAHKLGRAKHKDDADDKGAKKRSTERRKDKEPKVKRASSLEELSRTKLEDLTDKPTPASLRVERRAQPAPAKPERRSWGDDARDALFFRDAEPAGEPSAELTDFQTVTKKRKPRRRTDEAEREPARRQRAPSPHSPPSHRSNDSNDDMDSVHSLPADAAAPRAPLPPHASYADIARTRHNIPDLIESCNFYAEGEGAGEAMRAPETATPARIDADGYPALEARGARRTRDAKQVAARMERLERKERVEEASALAAPDCPAPDVVADRRPPVILLDSATRPRDMDGVTFGFDINEQLLGGAGRRPRCDLVRDALEQPGAPCGPCAPGVGVVVAGAAVAVVTGCAALHYVPPQPPADTHHLLQIVDYVGGAWEDTVRCGGTKVRYYSE